MFTCYQERHVHVRAACFSNSRFAAVTIHERQLFQISTSGGAVTIREQHLILDY